MKICKCCLVSGKVQGVSYRASTVEQARRLGLTGFVQNLADGRVEVLACGDAAKIEALIAWLWQGPPAARVQSVEVQDAEAAQAPGEFTTR